VKLLVAVGVDPEAKIDPGGYGSALFYAAQLGRTSCLDVLWKLGVDLAKPCTKYGELPVQVARRHPDPVVTGVMEDVILRDQRAAELLQRVIRKRASQARGRVAGVHSSATKIQALFRAYCIRKVSRKRLAKRAQKVRQKDAREKAKYEAYAKAANVKRNTLVQQELGIKSPVKGNGKMADLKE